ncbi:MAG: Rne/Rng family ribonuclease [Gammaproteobacteria bacterium]|nr:Rne/Rng family ribonuclease [Gammaproteobacteria bacterium]
MIKRMLINATHGDELRVAITADAVLVDLDIEHPGQEQKKSNIYKGRITSIEPSLGAVFVDYGSERHGFLPLKEISPEYFLTSADGQAAETIDIKRVLKEGQEIVVQIDKEERGNKGAALTSFIALAGCYLVLMPNNPDSGGISRRIEGDDRDQLREIIEQLPIPEGMGIIIRTAGVSRSKDELEWDLKVLLRYWEAIKQAAVARPGPYLIHQESDVIIRAVRDHLRQDISEIVVDNEDAYNRAKAYIQQVRPDFIEHLKLYTDSMPIFSRFLIEKQIEAAYQREVRLPSGGAIVIDHSEALVAIDINSARATKGSSIEETALQTNLEAADEIAKQLRIRDIGGLVVIDFIDMTPARNQREVENRLRNALKMDRARIQIGRISRFGLLEMSRQRLRASLSVSSETVCPRCEGRSTIRSVESVAIALVHLIQENASRSNNAQIQVQLPLDIATFVMNEKRDAIKEIETQSSVKVIIIPNEHLKSPNFHIKTIRDDSNKNMPSYKQVRVPKPELIVSKSATTVAAPEPAIQQYLSNDIQPPAPKPQSNGLIKRLWDVMFGSETPTVKKPERKFSNGKRQPSQRQEPILPRVSGDSLRDDRGGRARNNNKPRRPQPQRDGAAAQPRRDDRTGDRNNRTRDNRDRNVDHRLPAKPAVTSPVSPVEKSSASEVPVTENLKPILPPVIENHSAAPEKVMEKALVNEKPIAKAPEKPAVKAVEKAVEKVIVAEKPVEKAVIAESAQPAAMIPAAAQPAVAVAPQQPTAPSVPAAAYQKDYKGLSSGKKPLQQVTTKKE